MKVTVERRIGIIEMIPNKGKYIFLERDMIRSVNDALFDMEKDPAVSVVILTG